MDILNTIGNIFLGQSEFWWLAFLFIFGWVWTLKVDNVDTVMAAHVNLLQDLKVDTDEVPILQNILGGSLFGVWSQSDVNKGLSRPCAVDSGSTVPTPGETVTGVKGSGVVIMMTGSGGNWGAGTGTGNIYLGRCVGRFEDNEDLTGSVSGANFCTVNMPNNAEGVDYIRNGELSTWNGAIDPNDFPDEFTVANNDANNYIHDNADGTGQMISNNTAAVNVGQTTTSNLTAGKIYKFSITITNHVVGDVRMVFVGAFALGPVNMGWAGNGTYELTFEATATATLGFQIYRDNAGNSDYDFSNITLYEITPCCTAVDSLAWDGDEWTKDNTLDLYREHWDGGTNTKEGSFYALRCVPSALSDYINWRYDLRSEGEHLAKFYGKTVIMGMWVKTSLANHFRISIYEQGGVNAYSDYHAGDGNWEWLEVPYTFGTTATWLYIQLRCNNTPNIDGSSIIYISQPMLIFCNAVDGIIGEGNYVPKPQEFIHVKVPIHSLTYDVTTGWSDMAYTDLNIEADSDAMLPKGAKAILVHTGIADTGSGAASDVHLCLRRDAVFATMGYTNSVAGKANNLESHASGIQYCDMHGDVDIHLDASAAGQLDIDMFEYHGVQVI